RVKYPRRVRVLDLPQHLDVVPLTRPPHRRDEVAEAIYREERRALEGRDVEGTREVCAVMLDVVKLRPEAALRDAELTSQVVLQVAHLRGVGKALRDRREYSAPAASLSPRGRTVAPRQILRRARRG